MNFSRVTVRLLLTLVLLLMSVATASAQTMADSSITVDNGQKSDGTTLTIPSATIDVDGWIVVHDSDAAGNIVAPAIISEPVALKAGTTDDIEITLTKKVEGDYKVFVMLHVDEGVVGTYEFPGADIPVQNSEGAVVVPMTVSAEAEMMEDTMEEGDSSITVQDQAASGTNVTIPSATINVDGWIVIHDSDAAGNVVAPAIISKPVAIKAGTTDNIVIEMTKDVSAGGKVFAMLHVDAGVIGTYEFPGADVPIQNGEQVVVVPFNVTAATPAPTTMPTTGTSNYLLIATLVAGVVVLLGGAVVARRAA